VQKTPEKTTEKVGAENNPKKQIKKRVQKTSAENKGKKTNTENN
jgi:hypothetical protein